MKKKKKSLQKSDEMLPNVQIPKCPKAQKLWKYSLKKLDHLFIACKIYIYIYMFGMSLKKTVLVKSMLDYTHFLFWFWRIFI